nr:MAG TPA: hypothetical protein [Caudoviricetes sp.]
MNRTKIPMGPGTTPETFQAASLPKQDFQAEHRERVRQWLSQTPFASFLNSLRSGTTQDQLSCMLQVERWLQQALPEVLYGRYTRKRFLADLQRLSELFGLTVCSSLMKEYQSRIPRTAMMPVS